MKEKLLCQEKSRIYNLITESLMYGLEMKPKKQSKGCRKRTPENEQTYYPGQNWIVSQIQYLGVMVEASGNQYIDIIKRINNYINISNKI